MKTKFDSLDALIQEIDTWQKVLADKKASLLKLAALKNEAEEINRNAGDFMKKYQALNKAIHGYETRKFKACSIPVKQVYYDMINSAARAEGKSVSKYLKSKYFYNLVLNDEKDRDAYILDQYKKYGNQLTGLNDKGGKNQSIALAMDENDDSIINSVASKLGLKTPRDVLKLCVAMFLNKDPKQEVKDHVFPTDLYDFKSCKSSNISSYAYDDKKHILFIHFNQGGIYQYDNVSLDLYKGLEDATSKGTYFNSKIRSNSKITYKKVK